MRFLRPLRSLIGIFQCLPGMFVPGQVIFFSVMRGRCTVRVRCEFVKFRCPLMRVVWHCVLPSCMASSSWSRSISQTVQLRTLTAFTPPEPSDLAIFLDLFRRMAQPQQ